MINVNKLKGKIVEKGMTISSVAAEIGISAAALYSKLDNNSNSTMLIREASAIGKLLELTSEEMLSIFFAPDVSNMRLDNRKEAD